VPMFKRVLLCYDGSEKGRRALRHGAELAISLGSQISVLAIVPASLDAAMHLSRSTGLTVFDSEAEYRNTLNESLAWLSARGITATAHLAHGEVIDTILGYAKTLGCDLIVVGQYPQSGATRWWSGAKRTSLAEHATCSVFISIGG
jgi:nucleotide-binding universal stress UspA family protein